MQLLADFKFLKAIFSFLLGLIMAIVNLVNPPLAPFDPPPDIIDTPEVEMMDITHNNESDYVIVRAAQSTDSEKYAAETLQDYLRQICGTTIPLVTDDGPAVEKEIIVGQTNRELGGGFTFERNDLGEEGFIIRTLGSKLVILGGQPRGTIYGVFTFLEEALGCRWFSSKLIVIPKMEDLKIPKDIDIKQKPYFEYRETDWISPRDKIYSLANKQNGNIYRKFSQAEGGNMGYAGSFAHTLTTVFVPAWKYFDGHPEYYALGVKTGVRSPDQLCLTNPDVLRIIIDEVRQTLRANPQSQIVSLTQHDNQNYCVCDNCKALDDHEGSHAGTMIHFANAVADAIKDEFPNVAVDTFAYQYTRKPPKHVVPKDNVIIRLCSIECCFTHDLDDPLCGANADFHKDLTGWKKICDRIYIWDYTTNYSNFLGPFNNFGVMQNNMQFFAENNVKGIYEEGNYMASSSDAEFAELRAYLLCKLLWDPYIDYDATMNDFLRAYYGEGWQYVREYIDMTVKKSGVDYNHMYIFDKMDKKGTFKLTPNEIDYCNTLWAKAADLAGKRDTYDRVKRSELSWRYWKACNKLSEFSRISNPLHWKDENKLLYADYQIYNITRLNEGRDLSANPDFTKTPNSWYDKK